MTATPFQDEFLTITSRLTKTSSSVPFSTDGTIARVGLIGISRPLPSGWRLQPVFISQTFTLCFVILSLSKAAQTTGDSVMNGGAEADTKGGLRLSLAV